MKGLLSAAVARARRLVGSSASGDDEDERASPGLYECERCGAVFISKPPECSSCETDEFTAVGTFEDRQQARQDR